MKKIVNTLFLSIAAIFLVSCNNDNNPNHDRFNDTPEAGYVMFDTIGDVVYNIRATDTACGGVRTLEIPVLLSSVINFVSRPGEGEQGDNPTFNTPVNTEDLQIQYTITDIVGSSAGLDISAVIPANTGNGSVIVNVPENFNSDAIFKLTITGTNRSEVMAGMPDSEGAQEVTIRVNKSNSAALYGAYTVAQTQGSSVADYNLTINPGMSANEIILSNVFNQEPLLEASTQTRVIVNADGTLSFPPFLDNLLYTSTVASVGNVYFDGTSGTYDSCKGELNITYRLRRGPNQTATSPINIVLTRR